MATKIGKYTLKLDNPPSVISFASTVSKKESEGPLKNLFDTINLDSTFGQSSWEKAESRMPVSYTHLYHPSQGDGCHDQPV